MLCLHFCCSSLRCLSADREVLKSPVQIALNRVQRDVLTPAKRTYFKDAFDIGLQTIPRQSRVVVDDGMIHDFVSIDRLYA